MAPSRALDITVRNRESSNDDSDKDSTEEELERLVFGDSAGFRQGISSFKALEDLSKGKELVLADEKEDDEDEAETGLDAVDDAELFFLDARPSDYAPAPIDATDGEEENEGERPAWSDSDDERITLSLASRPQLRKLRRTEAEDIVTGKDYSRRLRKQFQLLNPLPEWAQTARPHKKRRTSSASSASASSSADEMDMDDKSLSAQPLSRLLQDANSLTRTSSTNKKRKLRPEVIDVQRMKDLAASGPSAITTLQVHPNLPLLISSGPSSTIALHHLKPQPPEPNPLLTTLHIKYTPMYTALFHPSASDPRIFLGSRRRYFNVWNLSTGKVEKISRIYGHQDEQRSMEHFKLSPDGRYLALRGSARKGGGVLNILDANSLQWIAQARIESYGGIADFCWWRDGSGICIAGKNGEITEWDLEARSAISRWYDEGAVGTTTMALGGESGKHGLHADRWVAIGSSSGIVNTYDRRAWSSAARTGNIMEDINGGVPKHPKPLRVLDQLTTPISHLAFSPDGQLLVMASRWKADALRLVHLPSGLVYKNWPTSKTPFGRISAVAIGEIGNGDLVLFIGNERGAIRGWEVRG